MNVTHTVKILESPKRSKTGKITAIIKALIVIKALAFTTTRAIMSNSISDITDTNYQVFN